VEERVHSQNEVVIEIVGDAASRYARASHFTIVEWILLLSGSSHRCRTGFEALGSWS
jgi:hypothetical protein